MQASLESVLRLHDFLQVDSRNQTAPANATKHWSKTDAHKIRVFIVNPWKHEGVLEGEKTELINDPHGGLGGYSVSLSGLRDIKPLEIDDLKMRFDARKNVKRLVSGIDSAYALFLDDSSPSQHRQWFSPAQCSRGKRCKDCKKELRPCERCEEQLEMVGEKIRCMCDENSKSIRESIRWIRYCESNCADPTYPKHLKDEHFLLSEECLFSSVCREINKVLIANVPDGYVAGTYIEDEIREIMRPLREGVDKYLADTATLKEILLEELEGYTGEGLNDVAYLTTNEAKGIYTIVDIATMRDKHLCSTVLVARLAGDRVVIEQDRHDKLLAEALEARGVPPSQIVLAYQGETV